MALHSRPTIIKKRKPALQFLFRENLLLIIGAIIIIAGLVFGISFIFRSPLKNTAIGSRTSSKYIYMTDGTVLLRAASTGNDELIEALFAHQRGELQTAQMLYQKLMNNADDDTIRCIATVNLANLHVQAGNYRKAMEYYSNALLLEPNNAGILNNLGFIHRRLGNIDIAEVFFNQALSYEKQLPSAHRHLAHIYFEKQAYNKAIDEYKKAAHILPADAALTYNLGLAYIRSDRILDARTQYQHLIDAGQKDFVSRLGVDIGNYYYENNDLPNAIQMYEQSVSFNPSDPEALYNLALAYQKNGNIENAIAALEHAVTLRPSFNDAYLRLGTLYYDNGNFNRALQYYRTIEKRGYDNSAVLPIIADIYFKQKNFDTALRYYEQLIKTYDTPGDEGNLKVAYVNSGIITMNRNDNHTAIEYFKKAFIIDPHDAHIAYNCGLAFYRQAQAGNKIIDYDHAREWFYKAISINPHYADAYLGIGDIYYINHQFNQAIMYYRRLLKIAPEHINAYMRIADIHTINGNYQGAIAMYEKLTNINLSIKMNNKENIQVYISMANLYDKMHLNQKAIEILQRLIVTSVTARSIPDVYYNLGIYTYQGNNYDDAAQYFRNALSALGNDSSSTHDTTFIGKIQFALGNCYFKKGNYIKAREMYNNALLSDPNLSEAYYNRDACEAKITQLSENSY